MAHFCVTPAERLRGELTVPGDKSISHRFVMLSSLAEGTSTARNLLMGEDCIGTMNAFRAMGVPITAHTDGTVIVHGVGKCGLQPPAGPLYVGNSGTTMRLMTGLLAGQSFSAILTGDPSLSRRPMDRVVVPLRNMGAQIEGQEARLFPPLHITGKKLHGISHIETLGSAQVKSALMLAGLFADGETTITQVKKSRDHTERMLKLFGVPCAIQGLQIRICGTGQLQAPSEPVVIPGDISSAAFFMVAGLIVPDSLVTLKNVSLNETRTGILTVLQSMGAQIEVQLVDGYNEPRGDITVRTSSLHSTTIPRNLLPFLIDELPILMIACACAQGTSFIEKASELRVKETDRIESMTKGLTALGATVVVTGDDIAITGPTKFRGGLEIESYDDHRTAMSFIIAGLVAEEKLRVNTVECIQTSYPSFFTDLAALIG